MSASEQRPYPPEVVRERICARRDKAGLKYRISPATPVQLREVSDRIRALCPADDPTKKTKQAVAVLRWLFGHSTEMTGAEASAVCVWLRDQDMAQQEMELLLKHPDIRA